MAAAADAPATVVGTVTEARALDERAFVAWLDVKRALSGPHAAGERVAIAWDERRSGRARRFDDGARILVALAPLPTWSIWRERLGERTALGIARRGEALVIAPDAPTVESVAAWLARPASERASTAALPDLAAIVAVAEPTVAHGAIDRMDGLPGLAAALMAPGSEGPRARLAQALGDATRPAALRAAILALVARRELVVLAPEVARLAREPDANLAPEALAAWAALPGGIPAKDAAALLARPEPAVRAAVLAHAAGVLDDAAVEAHLEDEPAGEVRAAAVHAWVARRGMDAWPRIAPLLDEPSALEGAAAVRALGGLGEPAAARLAKRARERPLAGARGPMLALTFAGPKGAGALRALAADHPDPAARALATFLLGREPPAHAD